MKRLDYETLAMEEIVVAMENGFLGGSIDFNPEGQNATITSSAQEYESIDASAGFAADNNGNITWE